MAELEKLKKFAEAAKVSWTMLEQLYPNMAAELRRVFGDVVEGKVIEALPNNASYHALVAKTDREVSLVELAKVLLPLVLDTALGFLRGA